MSTNNKDEKELTDEEKKAKAEEEGLSEDELEGVSGGAGVARPVGAIPKPVVGTAVPGAAGIPGAGSYHIKTGPVFSKDNKSLPGGGQQQGH